MTVKSQTDLNKPETHSTEVLLSTIEELERTKKQLEIARTYIEACAEYFPSARSLLKQIDNIDKQKYLCYKYLRGLVMFEIDLMNARLNISFTDLWLSSYKKAKSQTPVRLPDETKDQYYRDLGISTLFEFSEQIKNKAEELTRIAIDEDR